MNLANSAIIEPPKLLSFGYPPMETDNVGDRLGDIAATRIEDPGRICRCTARYNGMLHMHDDNETISEKIAYRKHIKIFRI